jgi:hypothetical protein
VSEVVVELALYWVSGLGEVVVAAQWGCEVEGDVACHACLFSSHVPRQKAGLITRRILNRLQ